MRVKVFAVDANPAADRAFFYTSKKWALNYIANGDANGLDDGSIQLTKRWKTPKPVLNAAWQSKVYEAVGIEPYPKFVSGGLTRTETRPAKFKAARVAH